MVKNRSNINENSIQDENSMIETDGSVSNG
jgi:hypothetical protein